MSRAEIMAIPDALLRRGRIGCATLVHMDVQDSPRYWWNGLGTLTYQGQEYTPANDLIGISQIGEKYGASAQTVTLSVAAQPEWLDLMADQESRIVGRAITISGLMLTSMTLDDNAPMTPIGSKFSMFTGTMTRPRFSESFSDAGIELECMGLFASRAKPPRAYLTDADQKALYPGDLGLEYVPKYEGGYKTRWI